ncbi:MAG TPA: SRPBCC domain-containing protein [bacterium]|nr:SRPBCC domain-containing protein [bacterium]
MATTETAVRIPGAIDLSLEYTIDAPPERVWQALTAELARWWGSGFHLGETPTDLTLELEVGGRLLEFWGDRGGALWGRVTGLEHGRWVELEGRFGIAGPVIGIVCWEVEPLAAGTRLKLSHTAHGLLREGTGESYTYGWNLLLGENLKAWVERGEARGLPGVD